MSINIQDNVVPHFQTQHDLRDNAMTGIELLIRCEGECTPQAYIEALTLQDLNCLTLKLIETAYYFTSMNVDQTCSVNIELKSLADPVFIRALEKLADGVKCSRVILEVTERQMPTGVTLTEIRENMFRLQKCGFLFSLDDYGTFHSHNIRLLALPFREVKISKELFYDYYDLQDLKGLKSLVELLQGLKHKVVIEGIENTEHYYFTRHLEDVLLQGYYFSKPQPLIQQLIIR